jgi:hypothetical protein
MNQWPSLPVKKDDGIDVSENMSLPIIHGGGCWWGLTPSRYHPKFNQKTNNFYRGIGFEIYFQRLAQEVAVMIPSAPATIIGFRPAAQLAIEQWWSQAKRNAFRTWSHLINSDTGIFIVTKAIRTKRVAQCLSSGERGQQTHIHVHGLLNIPRSNAEVKLPSSGTTWTCTRNDMQFKVLQADENKQYTVFIERASSRMFLLTDALRTAARNLWEYLPLSFYTLFGISWLTTGNACTRRHLNQRLEIHGRRHLIRVGFLHNLHRRSRLSRLVGIIQLLRRLYMTDEIVSPYEIISSSSKAAIPFSLNTRIQV